MSSDNIAIRVDNLGKCFHIYENPQDRLKQSIFPRLQRWLGLTPSHYARDFIALQGVSFTVAHGETVGIIGRNGSGKSTLLQIICGTLSNTEGSVETYGRVAALLELGSGFNPEFTGRENVYMNAAVLGMAHAEIDARMPDILAFADIGDFIDQPVKTYSSGMLVRLAFAVSIHVDPDILIVDEALSVGDELFQRKCFSRIEAIRQRGATILFVSHSASTVVGLCDRAILLDAGHLLADGSPRQVVAFYQKMLYATPERRRELRETLQREGLPALTASNEADANREDQAIDALEGHDAGLVPQTSSYDQIGACIEDMRIETLTGRRVNMLVPGREYIYRYHVRFEQSADAVRFGMLLKMITGFELGGAVSAPSMAEALPFVEAGSVYDVRFHFRCALQTGTYFLNAGVVGCIGGEEVYLHRLIDACMFRVVPMPSTLVTGIIDFSCRADVRMVE